MKKVSAVVVALLVFLCSLCLAENVSDENTTVVKMPYKVVFTTYEREGLYTGAVKDGLPDGFGVFVTYNSAGIEWHYIGEWVNGQFSGDGAQYWENGMLVKGKYVENEAQNAFVRWEDTLMTKWIDEYDANGNQHFITYYPGSLEQKYCEGFANISKQEVVSVTWFDKLGNELDLPEPLTFIAIAYPD